MTSDPKIALYAMNKKGLAALRGICESVGKTQLECVIASRDSAMAYDYFAEIQEFCIENEISFFERNSGHRPQSAFALAVGWRWLIHQEAPLIVFHDSLLPKYRGFAPLVSALLNQDDYIGVTALFASEEYDCGNILGQRKIKLSYPLKISEAIDQVSVLYYDLAADVSKSIVSGDTLIGVPQNEVLATYSLWRDEKDYRINWLQSSEQILRFIHTLGFPYLGASTMIDGTAARILDARIIEDVNVESRVDSSVGKVIFVRHGFPVVVCGRGLLQITDLRLRETGKSLLPLNKMRTRFH